MNFLVVIDVHRHYLTGGQGQCRTNGTAYPPPYSLAKGMDMPKLAMAIITYSNERNLN